MLALYFVGSTIGAMLALYALLRELVGVSA